MAAKKTAVAVQAEQFDVENEDHRIVLEEASKVKPSPEITAGPISKLFFAWVTPIFTLATKKRKQDNSELEQSDLWELPPKDQTADLTRRFNKSWTALEGQHLNGEDRLLTSKEASSTLTWSLWSVIRGLVFTSGLLKLLGSTLQFLYPLFINRILLFIQTMGTGEYEDWYGYAVAGVFFLVLCIKALVENFYFYVSFRAGWQARSIITTQVFQKSLNLATSARQTMTLGQIVNLMQLDSTKIELFVATSLHPLWDAVYQIIGYMVILYLYIGNSAFIGLGVMVFAIPIQQRIFKRVTAANQEMVKFTDVRVKLTNEVLQGILGIKMAGWEYNYARVIGEHRTEELKRLKSMMYLNAFSMAYMMSMPAIVAVAALSHYAVIRDGAVDAATLFTALSAFGQLRFPLMMFPNALAQLSQASVSRGRIANFFALDEIEERPSDDEEDDKRSSKSRTVLRISNGEFYWKKPDHMNVGDNSISISIPKAKGAKEASPDETPVESRPALEDINLSVKENSLVAIVGSVGSGKTSLVSAMLNEIYCSKGTVAMHDSVAYAAQTAWIFNDTVRANILFGEPMDERRYRKVLKACQLQHDLEVLQDGDMTMIGERGINLSGGQKQRISVARAAYSTKEIVILDDPLSALDPEVAHRMFKECFIKFLKDRTRILVTNQLNVLPQCDKVIVIEAKENEPGRIVEQGRYSSLLRSGLDFAKLMEKFHGSSDQEDGERPVSGMSLEDTEAGNPQPAVLTPPVGGSSDAVLEATLASMSTASGGDDEASEADDREDEKRLSSSMMSSSDQDKKDFVNKADGRQLMQVEERQKGAVAFGEYLGYIKAGGGYCFGAAIMFLFILNQFANVGNTAWVTFWTDDNNYERFSFYFYLIGYAITAVLLAVLAFVRGVGMFFMGLNASRQLHSGLVDSVLHAPMSFFDTTPIGRIISRFSKDLFLVDMQIPMFYSFFVFTVTFVLFSIVTIGYSTPYFLIGVPVVGVVYFYFLNLYRPLARDSKRLEAISRSPVYAHFSETLGGLSTIRAYSFAETFRDENAKKVDENMKSWYLVRITERWLSVRLELLGSVITALAASLAVYAASVQALSAGLAGLSLTFSMGITNLLNQTVRTFAELEAGMNSVERVLHYTNNIEQEAEFESKNTPEKSWPETGEIVINKLQMRYRKETPLVLKGISLTIKGGERVGVCGRTGSGKSSLLLCLLRLVEPVPNEDGSSAISIDGVDICKIGLHELRSKISIVPQSPVLFSGTVRENLDPFKEYSDDAIWDALEQCAMKRTVTEGGGLDGPVSEYGENFSQGQRQLLCLARSILAQARVLLLDEATSSVDYETDATIQATIRNSFSECTIITIAHRLNTVIDSDKILVLDSGNVAEFASPSTLLKNPESTFSSMVSELGPKMAAQLRSQARGSRRMNK